MKLNLTDWPGEHMATCGKSGAPPGDGTLFNTTPLHTKYTRAQTSAAPETVADEGETTRRLFQQAHTTNRLYAPLNTAPHPITSYVE